VKAMKTLAQLFGRTKVNRFEIAKLDLHDGDIVVLRTDMMLTQEQLQYLRDRYRAEFPGIKVVVLSAGLEIGVLADKRTKRAA
jgi:hypothetical protein